MSEADGNDVIDKGWAWVVVIAGQIILAVQMGMYTTSGIFVVETMRVFHTTSVRMSMILACRDAIYTVVGIYTMGALSAHLHPRIQIMAGGVLMFLSYSLCFGATEVNHFFIYSVLFGLSIAMTWCQTVVQVSQYFKKYRTMALGILTSGTSIGTIVIPFLFNYLLDQYGLRGTLLIIGGLSLNIVPFGLLLRPVQFFTCRDELERPDVTGTKASVEMKNHDLSEVEACNDTNDEVKSYLEKASSKLLDDKYGVETIADEQNSDLVIHDVTNASYIVNSLTLSSTVAQNSEMKEIETRGYHFIFSRKFVSGSKLIDFALLRNLVFVSYQLGAGVAYMATTCHVVFMPQFAEQISGNIADPALCLSIFGAVELVARFFWGFFGDYSTISRLKMAIFCTFSLGILLNINQIITSFWWLAAFHALSGLFVSAIYVLVPVVLIDLFGYEVQSRSLCISIIVSGGLDFAMLPLAGYIRDVTGQYAASLHLIGSMYLLSCVTWLFVTLPMSRRKTRMTSRR